MGILPHFLRPGRRRRDLYRLSIHFDKILSIHFPMSDPSSITSGIIAVLDLTYTVTKCLVDIKDASKDCSKILVELSVTRGVLTTLKDSVMRAKADSTWLATIETLDVPNGPLAHFKATLEDLLSRVNHCQSPKELCGH